MQEDLDYYVTSRVFKEKYLPDCFLQQAPALTSVDAYGNINDMEFCIEIKQREKNSNNLLKYPHAELRVDKYNRMRQASNGRKLFYTVLLNEEECYIYDLDTIDWSKVNIVDWTMKRTQYSNDTRTITVPIYTIPYNIATKYYYCGDFFYDYFTKDK